MYFSSSISSSVIWDNHKTLLYHSYFLLLKMETKIISLTCIAGSIGRLLSTIVLLATHKLQGIQIIIYRLLMKLRLLIYLYDTFCFKKQKHILWLF